jgi:hypothetical protein
LGLSRKPTLHRRGGALKKALPVIHGLLIALTGEEELHQAKELFGRLFTGPA